MLIIFSFLRCIRCPFSIRKQTSRKIASLFPRDVNISRVVFAQIDRPTFFRVVSLVFIPLANIILNRILSATRVKTGKLQKGSQTAIFLSVGRNLLCNYTFVVDKTDETAIIFRVCVFILFSWHSNKISFIIHFTLDISSAAMQKRCFNH